MTGQCANIDKVSTHSVHQFAEKVALITDGTEPVGKAVALQLALLGAYVIVGVPGDSPADEAIRDLETLGTLAAAVNYDPMSNHPANALIGAVESKFGRLDLLVNCLKAQTESTFLEMSKAELGSIVDRGLGSTILLTKHACELMARRPKARIVNVAIRDTDQPSAAAVQNGMEGFTRALAKELPIRFRVNCVAIEDVSDPEPVGKTDQFYRRPGVAPDDVARVVVFLLSSEAVALNGQVLRLG